MIRNVFRRRRGLGPDRLWLVQSYCRKWCDLWAPPAEWL